MEIKVIKVTKNGKVGYLTSTTIFGGLGGKKPIVDNPLLAKDYNLPENQNYLEQEIEYLKLPGKESAAMSGVSVDTAHIVNIKVNYIETNSVEAYPVKQNKPKL